MSARLSLALSLGVVVALAAVGIGSSFGANGKKEERHPSEPFHHPVVMATVGDGTVVIQDARVANLGERSFVVGSYLGGAKVAASKGSIIWTPVEKINQLVEFKSVDEVSQIIRLD